MTSFNEQIPPASGAAGAAGIAARDTVAPRKRRRFSADLSALGEPALWGFGGALALGIIMIAVFLMAVLYNGATTFWPKPIERVELTDGSVIAGTERRGTIFRPQLASLDDDTRSMIEANDGFAYRTLYQTANFDLYGDDFQWVADFEVENITRPEDFYYFERQTWGVFIGRIAGMSIDGQEMDYDPAVLRREQRAARDRFREIRRIERSEIGRINHQIERERLAQRRALLQEGQIQLGETADVDDMAAQASAGVLAESQARIEDLQAEFQVLQARVNEIRATDRRFTVTLEEVGGRQITPEISQIVRYFPANTIGVLDKIGIYVARWWEFVSAEPREANTQGGVLPAIFGTVAMTLLMVVFVAPFGVITALYLREYAKQG
ncbi:MAG: phosphate ABC transporter, permease protein PstA, partial [Rhodobacteraceae bacterium]